MERYNLKEIINKKVIDMTHQEIQPLHINTVEFTDESISYDKESKLYGAKNYGMIYALEVAADTMDEEQKYAKTQMKQEIKEDLKARLEHDIAVDTAGAKTALDHYEAEQTVLSFLKTNGGTADVRALAGQLSTQLKTDFDTEVKKVTDDYINSQYGLSWNTGNAAFHAEMLHNMETKFGGTTEEQMRIDLFKKMKTMKVGSDGLETGAEAGAVHGEYGAAASAIGIDSEEAGVSVSSRSTLAKKELTGIKHDVKAASSYASATQGLIDGQSSN